MSHEKQIAANEQEHFLEGHERLVNQMQRETRELGKALGYSDDEIEQRIREALKTIWKEHRV